MKRSRLRARPSRRQALAADEKTPRLSPPAVADEIVKLAFETSKKALPAPLTFTRADAVDTAGSVTTSDPSFGVDAFRTIGNVKPPSSESVIVTFGVLTGAAFVFATL